MARGGAPLPVREYDSAAENLRHAAEVRARLFAGAPFKVAPKPCAGDPTAAASDLSARELISPGHAKPAVLDPLIAASLEAFGKPDLRSIEQRKGLAQYSGRHCLLIAVSVTGYSALELASDARAQPITKARFIACWLMRRFAGKSQPQIGLMLSRDHSSVFGALKAVEQAIADLGLRDLDDPVESAERLWFAEWPAHKDYGARVAKKNAERRAC